LDERVSGQCHFTAADTDIIVENQQRPFSALLPSTKCRPTQRKREREFIKAIYSIIKKTFLTSKKQFIKTLPFKKEIFTFYKKI